MDQYEMIRTGCRVYGKNISEMARITGHLRNTIKKAIRGEPWGYKTRGHQPFPVLNKYLPVITEWLGSDRDKPKNQRHTARRIYNRLVEVLREGLVTTCVRLRSCGTAGKPGGNGENKRQPQHREKPVYSPIRIFIFSQVRTFPDELN